jgi:phage terminase large subunit
VPPDAAEIRRRLQRYKSHPRLFVAEQIGAVPEPWQERVLADLGRGCGRLTVRSGHGVGKTALLAWIVLWFLSTHYPCKVGCTAPTAHQLEDVLWPEIGLWLGRLRPFFRRRLALGRLALQVRGSRGVAFAVGRTARPEQPEALQGLHSENVVLLVDEASGVDDRIFEAALGTMSTPGAITLLAGNPTRASGFFFDTHHRLAGRWTAHRVSSTEVPRARGHVADILARWGAESNAHRIRVEGEFPLAGDDAVISRAWCEAATRRRRSDTAAGDLAPVWGLDVARFGDDRSALAKRCGNVLLEPVQAWRGADTMATAGRVLAEWNATEPGERPARILVDEVGIGAGVLDRLREHGLPVTGVNVGETALDSDHYSRRRDELWFRGRAWLARDDAILPDDQALIGELTATRYTYTSAARIEVDSKAELKRRGLPSPDLADAFLLTFAVADIRRAKGGRRRPPYPYRPPPTGRSWMRA